MSEKEKFNIFLNVFLTGDELKIVQKCRGKHINLNQLFECDSCSLLFDAIFNVNNKE